ncbi:MAG: HD-GYP domain-containing protein [Lachnospiraceae bacterium]
MDKSQERMARGHYLQYTLKEQLVHGMQVSNLAWSVARRMGLSDDFCHQVAVAGMLHDIGKEEISGQIDENQERLVVEEMHYVRLHAAAGYEILKREGYPEEIQKMVLHHHENMDGAGYPDNLSGEKIPWAPGSSASATSTRRAAVGPSLPEGLRPGYGHTADD